MITKTPTYKNFYLNSNYSFYHNHRQSYQELSTQSEEILAELITRKNQKKRPLLFGIDKNIITISEDFNDATMIH